MSNKRMLIIGANSYVGARLYIDLSKEFEIQGSFHKTLLFPELIELDLTNEAQTIKKIQDIKSDIIIQVSAVPSIGKCKEDKDYAFKLNVGGTKTLVNAANKIGAKVVYISSVAAQDPKEIYDITKFQAEEIVKTTESGFLILRSGLLIGQSPNTSNTRFHNFLLKNIKEKTKTEYDNLYKLQPTWLGHLSEVITKLAKREDWNHLVPITVKELKTRFEIATDILKNFGVECKPITKGKTGMIKVTQVKLKKLNLPIYDYSDILAKTIEEIKIQLMTYSEQI